MRCTKLKVKTLYSTSVELLVESEGQGLCSWRSKEREEDGKARALAENAFDLNPPMMGFGNPLAD